MIKLCVFSDSHGIADHMITAVEREKPSLCIFLGDGERDIKALQERFPALPLYAVRGNCDLHSKLSDNLICTVGGVCLFAAHGHLHDVKYEPGLDSLAASARESGAVLALYGHTHHARVEIHDGITFLNPGSIGPVAHPGYAVLLLEEGRFTEKLMKV